MTNASRRIRRIGAGIVLAGAAAGGVTLALPRPEPPATAEVVTVAVGRGEVTLDVATMGTVEPATTRSLSFPVDGTVESIAVRPGSRVEAGRELAVLDDAAASEQLSAARDALATARARLTDATRAAVETTRAAVACARASSGRPTTTGAVAAACAARRPDTGADPVLGAEQAVNSAARAVDDAERALAGTVLTAPIAGTVVSVAGRVGDRVSAGSAFAGLADTSDMQVVARFPEADAGALAAGQGATVTLAGADEARAAKVVQVDPAGVPDGTLVRYGVVLAFTDPPDDLLAGRSAQVRVRTGEVTGVLRVPSTAVHDVSGNAGTVLVHDGGGPVERSVTLGLRGDQFTEVRAGLAEGDRVVRSW